MTGRSRKPVAGGPVRGAVAESDNKASSDVLVPVGCVVLLRLPEAAVLALQPRPVAWFFVDQRWRLHRIGVRSQSRSRGRHGHAATRQAEGRVAPHEAVLRPPPDERVAAILLGPVHSSTKLSVKRQHGRHGHGKPMVGTGQASTGGPWAHSSTGRP